MLSLALACTPGGGGEAPASPILEQVLPAGPANDNHPRLSGQGTAASLVRVYHSADCSGAAVALAEADDAGRFEVVVPVADDVMVTLSADAEAHDQRSPCSAAALTYQEDSTAPAAPELLATEPTSPSTSLRPRVRGTAEPLSQVAIFTSPDCGGEARASLQAGDDGRFDLELEVMPGVITHLRARAVDAAGNVSGCSEGPLRYESDLTPPESPVLLSVSPASPANDNAPSFSGTAQPGAQVLLTTSCAEGGALLGETVAAPDGTFTVAITVVDDSLTSVVARAKDTTGNVSPCSEALTYREDSTAPLVPKLLGTSPVSPSRSTSPRVSVEGEAGTTVAIFTHADCSGEFTLAAVIGPTRVEQVQLEVPPDREVQLSALLTDPAGNRSGCSASLSYLADTLPPQPPNLIGLTPASPSRNTTPTLSVSGEPQARVHLYRSAGCSGAAISSVQLGANGEASTSLTLPSNATSVVVARTTDAAGNSSECTQEGLTYVTDTLPPSLATARVLDGNAADLDLQLDASNMAASWSGFTDPQGIASYEWSLSRDPTCRGEEVAATPMLQATSVSLSGLELTDRTYYNCVRATDGVGNVSGWRGSDGIAVDTRGPIVSTFWPAEGALGVDLLAAPTVTFSEPMDPSSLDGTTVRLLREGTQVDVELSCTPTRCVLTPRAPLAFGTTHRIEVTQGARDLVGHVLQAPAGVNFHVRPRHWFTPVQPAGVAAGSRTVRLAAGPDGSALALWTQPSASSTALRWSHYRRGTGWAAAATLITLPSGSLEDHTVAVDVMGNALAVWVASPPLSGMDQLWVARRSVGGSWQTPQLVMSSTSAIHHPQVALDSQGSGWIVWALNNPLTAPHHQVHGARLTAGGGLEPALEIDGVPTDASQPALAINTHGDAVIAFTAPDAQGRARATVRRFSASSATWDAAMTAPSADALTGEPHVHLDDAGTVGLVFRERTVEQWGATSQRLIFVAQQQGQTFSAPIDLSSAGYPDSAPAVLFSSLGGASGGRLVTVWIQGYTPGPRSSIRSPGPGARPTTWGPPEPSREGTWCPQSPWRTPEMPWWSGSAMSQRSTVDS